jgi:hypothetical protein
MNIIGLQKKTEPLEGIVEKYWFENTTIGLDKTLFHRIIIPLSPFDSDLEYVSQPEETEIVIEWLKLNLNNPDDLDNLTVTSQDYEDLEASVYVGSAHNVCEVEKLTFNKLESNKYLVKGDLFIDFESEGVGKNEKFSFIATVYFQESEGK